MQEVLTRFRVSEIVVSAVKSGSLKLPGVAYLNEKKRRKGVVKPTRAQIPALMPSRASKNMRIDYIVRVDTWRNSITRQGSVNFILQCCTYNAMAPPGILAIARRRNQ